MEKEEFFFTDGCMFMSEEAIKNPELVIKEFFSLYPIAEVKVNIWKFYKAANTTRIQLFDLPDKSSDLLLFFETFIMFNMAVYEQHRRKETG
jgi:hypothetical protein